MMRYLRVSLFAAAALALALPQPPPAVGQTTGKDVSKKAADAWDTVKAYTVEKKNEAVAYSKKLVSESDTKIKQLEAKASKASGDTKVEYDKVVKDLKAKRLQASKKLDEMGKATGAAWDSAKEGFADAYKDLHEAYEKAAAKFK
jgi:hypothetical protein